jgi:predicted metal-dependent hydrolase
MRIDYTLIRSKRKTAALYIRGGGVEVRAPAKMPKRDIDKFVASKEKWIADKLQRAREQAEYREAFSLDYGDTVTYRGKPYPIAA